MLHLSPVSLLITLLDYFTVHSFSSLPPSLCPPSLTHFLRPKILSCGLLKDASCLPHQDMDRNRLELLPPSLSPSLSPSLLLSFSPSLPLSLPLSLSLSLTHTRAHAHMHTPSFASRPPYLPKFFRAVPSYAWSNQAVGHWRPPPVRGWTFRQLTASQLWVEYSQGLQGLSIAALRPSSAMLFRPATATSSGKNFVRCSLVLYWASLSSLASPF
jgi:hypothetical protein